MLNAVVKSRGLPHVIVVGNEKGGSGKTTIAMHIAVALMKSGQRLASEFRAANRDVTTRPHEH